MKPTIKQTFCVALAAALFTAAAAHAEDTAESRQVKELQAQVRALKEQLDAVETKLEQLSAARQGNEPAKPAPGAAGTGGGLPYLPSQPPSASSDGGQLAISGYGEINYYRPTHRPELTTADLTRAVFGFSYAFDDRTRFNSEFELEHAVASADDAGEFEIEQFYVDRDITDQVSLKAGLFLMPVGILNQTHEPTRYYGVQRNLVEKLIIPTTWREGGIGVHGTLASGFRYDIGLTTGLSLADWDANPETPLYQTAQELAQGDAPPLQASHQELSLAGAQHLAQYLSLSYRGVPGLDLGGSVFTGQAEIPAVPEGLPDQRVTLWEAHARYSPGRLDLAGLYARGTIGDTAAFNLANAGASNPEPAAFDGWYLQAAYTVWREGASRLTPFARYARYDMSAKFEGIPAGFTPVPTGSVPGFGAWPRPSDKVWTYGANYYLTPKLVFKIDYQHFDTNRDLSRFDLGMGLEF